MIIGPPVAYTRFRNKKQVDKITHMKMQNCLNQCQVS